MVEGDEVIRYKNMELQDALKKIEVRDFHFNVHMDGKITFEIHYEQGAQFEFFPEPRARMARGAKSAAKAEAPEVKKSKNRSIQYVCPACGAIIRAKKEINVVCGDCDVPFE